MMGAMRNNAPYRHYPTSSYCRSLDDVLRLGSGASSVCGISVTRELDLLSGRELENLLESLANCGQDILALVRSATLAAGNVTVTSTGDCLSGSSGPNTDTIESLADIDDNAHDFTVILVLKGLADRCHHDLKPKTVNLDIALLLVLVGPFATMLVLGVLPLWAYTSLEKVVVGFQGEL